MRSLLERDLDYFATDESDILIAAEARAVGERRRADDEFNGYFEPEGEGDDDEEGRSGN